MSCRTRAGWFGDNSDNVAMRLGAAVLLLVQLVSSGCVGGPSVSREIVLDPHTNSLEGWFSGRGEWNLFPSQKIGAYDPFKEQGNGRCVSLVNGTGKARGEYSAFDGRRVFVTGVATKYGDLETGTSPSDRLLSKKYFDDQPVENFCLRDLVFVVRDVRLSREKD
jgi:hypothetical protein